jgi:hypothetical protein
LKKLFPFCIVFIFREANMKSYRVYVVVAAFERTFLKISGMVEV